MKPGLIRANGNRVQECAEEDERLASEVAGADYEGVNEVEERAEQLPSWNRRGGPSRDGRRGGRWIE